MAEVALGDLAQRYATMLLLDDGCYANMYTNLTKASACSPMHHGVHLTTC